MYPINNKDKCKIYDRSFLADLADHTVIDSISHTWAEPRETKSSIYLDYKESGPVSAISLKISELSELLPEGESAHKPTDTMEYNWLPAIISHDKHIQSKEILAGNIVGNKVLGIENFISVQKPKFRSWQILDDKDAENTDGVSLSVDWTVNSNIASIDPQYGVMCWYREQIFKTYALTDLPPMSIVYPARQLIELVDGVTRKPILNTGVKCIKINDTTIRVLESRADQGIQPNENVKWTMPDGPVFDYSRKDLLNISALKQLNDSNGVSDKILFYADDQIALYDESKLSDFGGSKKQVLQKYHIWISDGEFYSYFNNKREKKDFQIHRTTKLPSKTYLSPGLYHIYRAIYNALTVDRIKSSTTIGTVCYAEKLRKLCSVLATGPLIDRVTINYLYSEDLREPIDRYLNSPAPASTDQEIKELLSIINTITKKLNNLTDNIEQNNKNNYIKTPSQLYHKLVSKYGANLRISSNQVKKLKLKQPLKNGPHAYFDINHKTYCEKTATPSTDRIKSYIYNKFEYRIGDIVIKNSLDIKNNRLKSQSLRIYSDTNVSQRVDIPWDILIEPKSELLRINLGTDIDLPFTPNNNGEMKISYNFDMPDNTTVLWQLVDGPECLRFSNFVQNGQSDVNKRNRISYDSQPDFYIKKPGIYTVRCQVTKSSVLKAFDYIRLYIGDVDKSSVPPRTTLDVDDTIVHKYNAICSNLRQFAINKYGLLWIIDSDIYNIAQTNQEIINDTTVSSRMINQKIGLGFLPQVAKNAELMITFDTLDTTVKLNSILIENMREVSSEVAQCKSFYQDKIVRERDKIFNTPIFAARYLRKDLYGDSISIYGRGYDDFGVGVSFRQDCAFPVVSTMLAPEIKSYGGYSYSVVDQLGVEIPFHPVYEKSSNKVLSLQQLPNGIWGDGSDDSNTLVAKKPYKFDKMIDRNNMGGENPSFRCNMMNIPISGCVTLNKGYFHPNSGWYPANSSHQYPSILTNVGSAAYSSLSSEHGKNITSVQRYKTGRYKSYYFTGNGVFDMRGMTHGINTSYNTYLSRILLKDASDTNADLSDHITSHGYRNINSISFRAQENIDDLKIDRYLDRENEDSFVCDPIISANTDNDFYSGTATSVYSLPSDHIKDLTIQDLEIKINFLNYPNPKNMIIALEITNPNMPPLPDFDKIFISNSNQESGISELDNYLRSISDMNTSTNQNQSRTIYLYNQESLDNYSFNFNLLFSDNYSQQAIFDDYNKYDNYIISHSTPIYSDNPISPTLSSNSYSDRQTAKYKKAIKNNFISVNAARLAKFKNIPLKNTSFVLKIIILGTEENILSMDNVVNNSELSGLSRFELSRTSNTIANSICSWDLVVHTDKVSKFNNKNPRGHLDYNNSNTSILKGYNFIGDFTNKTYLIPKVNINAPYEYLANINYYCRYINDEDMSRPLSYREIKFPFIFFSFTPFFSVAGALVAIWQTTEYISRGGRGDPLINMLYDIRYQTMQQELERNYFQPGYEGVAQGYADKALVSLTKDDISWYKMEIPINRYEHSDILKLKKYNYIKLSSDNAKIFSMFKFDIVNSIRDLIDSREIAYTFMENVIRVGLYVSVADPTDDSQPPSNRKTITLKFKEGDIVELTGQNTASENGIYVVKTGIWSTFPDTLNLKFLVENRYYDSSNTKSIDYFISNIEAKKIIKIKGSRAADFFDIDGGVYFAARLDKKDPIGRIIKDKYILNIIDSNYTIIVLDSSIAIEEGYMYKNTSDTLLVYSDNTTANDDSEIGKWGLTKSVEELGEERLQTKIIHSVIGEGNYGYGTPYIDPDMYMSLSYDTNNLSQVYDTFNNRTNDKFKYNTIFLESNGTTTAIKFDPSADPKASLCRYYPFSINEYGYAKDTSTYEEFLSTEMKAEDKSNLLIDLVSSVVQPDKQNYYFMYLKSDKFTSAPDTGYLYIENDYVKFKPVQKLSKSQRDSIQKRIDFISTTGIHSELFASTPVSKIDNIPDLLTVYNNTPEELDVCEYPNFDNNSEICRKRLAKLKLLQLSDERAKMIKVLENDDRSSPNILPVYEIVYKELPQTGQEKAPPKVIIEYRIKDYFWFNIDVNQTCSIAEESMPRILYQIDYVCSPVLDYYEYPECASVCSSDTLDGSDFEFKPATIGKFSGQACISKKVEEEKQKYPHIKEWQTDEQAGYEIVTKKFFLSCEGNLRDVLLTVKERYLYPKIPSLPRDEYGNTIDPRKGLVKYVFNLDNNDSIKMKFRIIPRKLKTIDPTYQRYLYDYNGNLGKDLNPAIGGSVYNGLSVWRCIDVKQDSPTFGKMIDPPLFFKLQNEMIFRSFFGSVDGVEIKNSPVSEAKEFWEWIPYEYFDGPIID